MTVYELITKHEGRRKKPYKCSGGKNTIGIGWNFDLMIKRTNCK